METSRHEWVTLPQLSDRRWSKNTGQWRIVTLQN
jgi:hypothetical protein